MNYLGIDYGEKRIGLAKAMSATKIAVPLITILNSESIAMELQLIIRQELIDQIVIGLPISFDGQEHQAAESVRKFAGQLKKNISQPIFFENEILTSSLAAQHSDKIDESSAALILQSFLDHLSLGSKASK